jgi:hypothetical protein
VEHNKFKKTVTINKAINLRTALSYSLFLTSIIIIIDIDKKYTKAGEHQFNGEFIYIIIIFYSTIS